MWCGITDACGNPFFLTSLSFLVYKTDLRKLILKHKMWWVYQSIHTTFSQLISRGWNLLRLIKRILTYNKRSGQDFCWRKTIISNASGLQSQKRLGQKYRFMKGGSIFLNISIRIQHISCSIHLVEYEFPSMLPFLKYRFVKVLSILYWRLRKTFIEDTYQVTSIYTLLAFILAFLLSILDSSINAVNKFFLRVGIKWEFLRFWAIRMLLNDLMQVLIW